MRPHEVEPWFHSYRGRVVTLDAKYNLALFELLVWPHEVEPWFHSYRGRVETLDVSNPTLHHGSYFNDMLPCTYRKEGLSRWIVHPGRLMESPDAIRRGNHQGTELRSAQ